MIDMFGRKFKLSSIFSQNRIKPILDEKLQENPNEFTFEQDGAFSRIDINLNQRIGRLVPLKWPARSPGLAPVEIFHKDSCSILILHTEEVNSEYFENSLIIYEYLENDNVVVKMTKIVD